MDQVPRRQELELGGTGGTGGEGGVGSPNLGAIEVEEEQAAISAQGESGAVAVDGLVAVGHPDGGCGVASEPDGKAVGVGAYLEEPSCESLVWGS